jgi:hypothetical protein
MRSLRDRQLLRDRSPGLRPRAGLRNDYLLPCICVAFYMLRLSFLSQCGHHLQRLFIVSTGDAILFFHIQFGLQSTVLVAGLVLSFVINGLVNLAYGVLLVKKRRLGTYVPIWLATINFLFLIFQFYLILAR